MASSTSENVSRSFKNVYEDYRGEVLLDENKKLKNPYNSELLSGGKRLHDILNKHTASCDAKDASIYTGVTGQALLCLHLYLKLPDGNKDNGHLHRAVQWLKPGVDKVRGQRSARVSLLCGDCGPLAVSAVVHHYLGDTRTSRQFIKKWWTQSSCLARLCLRL